ncbi:MULTISPECIES: type II secretion system protein N [Gammaproteobacteria]|uniref:type II secretion system protein N n=1 Tax=Gammaproteobacteria TaxID=1236 RepID=UPI000DCF6911|nr:MULTISPECIES: type II secretion system protein N [Gammaproteobacteria]RTE86195.1 type II secretion system protein N [Aliidiomarina sp. B3213]TCZ91547.1 type II secretion system protein N [Lysobacter sp. N42]
MKFKLISLVVIVYLGALVVFLPARMVTHWAPIPQSVHISGVTGTIWNGTVDTVQVQGRVVKNIAWEIFPLALFTGKLATKVSVQSGQSNPFALNGYVNASMSGVSVEELMVRGDLEKTVNWLDIPAAALVPVRGEYTLHIEEFNQGQPLCSALKGQGRAFDVTTRIGQSWESVGDYQVTAQCDSGEVVLNMPEDNMLGIFFNLQLSNTGYTLNGHLKPTAQAPQVIRDALRMVGNPNSQGQYIFSAESR